MSEDLELLKLAAKAAGIKLHKSRHCGQFDIAGNAMLDWHNGKTWNPLKDDGDALRLAVDLRITVAFHEDAIAAMHIESGRSWPVAYDGDNIAATRRAIVRAAAEIGRAMP